MMIFLLAGSTDFEQFLIGYMAVMMLGFVVAGAPLFVLTVIILVKWWRTLAAKRRTNK